MRLCKVEVGRVEFGRTHTIRSQREDVCDLFSKLMFILPSKRGHTSRDGFDVVSGKLEKQEIASERRKTREDGRD